MGPPALLPAARYGTTTHLIDIYKDKLKASLAKIRAKGPFFSCGWETSINIRFGDCNQRFCWNVVKKTLELSRHATSSLLSLTFLNGDACIVRNEPELNPDHYP